MRRICIQEAYYVVLVIVREHASLIYTSDYSKIEALRCKIRVVGAVSVTYGYVIYFRVRR